MYGAVIRFMYERNRFRPVLRRFYILLSADWFASKRSATTESPAAYFFDDTKLLDGEWLPMVRKLILNNVRRLVENRSQRVVN